MQLDREVIGAGSRVVLVHGFAQTGRCWGPIAADLARDHEVVLLDAPGHGGSASIAVPFAVAVGLIGEVGGPGTYLGYSMGGRLALRLAIDRPDLVDRLVLIGASPGLADADERGVRRAADDELADRIEAIGIDAFLDEWLALPLFAGRSPTMQYRSERLRNTATGLASSLRLCGTGAQEPLWDRLEALTMPVLLTTGERDTKFTAIAEQMTARIGPNANHLVVPGAGHTAHLENPDGFLSSLRAWFAGSAKGGR